MFLVDDCESYSFSLPGSYELGVIYNNLQGEKPVRFYSLYKDGFNGFNPQQRNIIDYYKNKFESIKSQIQVFTGQIPIGKNKFKFVSTFHTGYVSELSDYLLDSQSADVCLIIDADSKRVFFRRDKKCDINLKKLATQLCNGWGYKYAAGGHITDKLLQFSKLFSPISS